MRIRALATALVASSVLLGTAGCGLFLETETLRPYHPSDGIGVSVGDLHILNALIITNDSGDAALVASVVNDGDSLELVNVEVRGETPLATKVGAYPGITKIGIADGNPIVFYGADVVAGQYVDVYFQYGSNDGKLISVPVLDGTEPFYAPYAPEAVDANVTG